jgi:hypothetical protein
MKKAQSSLEFLMIFGIGFSIIMVLSGIFFGYFNAEKETLDSKHLQNIGEELIGNIDKIYFLGNGNRITLNTKFPEGIENITIYHIIDKNVSGTNISFDYLNISYIGGGKIISQIFTTSEPYIRFNCTRCYHNLTTNISHYNDTSDFTGGFKRIRIESKGNWVSMDFIKE